MNTRGRHFMLDLFECRREALNDAALLERLLTEAAEAAGAHVVARVFHPFSPHGVSGVLAIEESHLSVHTWPEQGYAALDFYTCGDVDPEAALSSLSRALGAGRAELLEVTRGVSAENTLQLSQRKRIS
ncbi:MAG: adenosylmethionine decarboxylase [Polyangiaceae bacterium]